MVKFILFGSICASLMVGSLAAPLAAEDPVERDGITCAKGVHVITARGTGDPPGDGRQQPMAMEIVKQIQGSNQVALVYPAKKRKQGVPYHISEHTGRDHLTEDIKAYVKKCGANSKIALLGYSQGAQVVGDTLCGTSEGSGPKTPPLPSEYQKNIVAAVLMGDPSHNVDEKFVVGTSHHNGVLPRQNIAGCEPFTDRIVSDCDKGDRYCSAAKGKANLHVHGSYVKNYGTQGVNFVVNHYHSA